MEPGSPGCQEIPFNFDMVFHDKHGTDKGQYKACCQLGAVILDTAWNGFNCSVLANGHPCTGKTYTMFGLQEQQGLIYRVAEELLFRSHTSENPDKTYEITFSMFEIYREKIRDLLNPPTEEDQFTLQYQQRNNVRSAHLLTQQHANGLRVRDHPDGPYVEGVTVVPVRDVESIKDLLDEGEMNIQCDHRKIQGTTRSDRPIRGHIVVQIGLTVHEAMKRGVHESVQTKWSKINFVDLAERETPTTSSVLPRRDFASRQKEIHQNNKSLQALSNCLRAVGQLQHLDGKVVHHFPYRGSPLTMLLKDSFIGFGKVVLLNTVSPADAHFEESFATLQFAQRSFSDRTAPIKSRNIKRETKSGADMKEELQILLHLEQDKHFVLEEELERAKKFHAERMAKLRGDLDNARIVASRGEASRSINDKLRVDKEAKKAELSQLRLQVDSCRPELVAEHEALVRQLDQLTFSLNSVRAM